MAHFSIMETEGKNSKKHSSRDGIASFNVLANRIEGNTEE